MRKLRIGIIGTGNIADTAHAPAISALEQTSLVAVLSRDKEKGQSFLRRHGIPSGTVYTSLDTFAADSNIDLVIICSPDGLHFEQALACLKAGKHVLLEKPLTLNAEDALKLVELADANKLTLATGFHLRSHNGHRTLYERVVEKGEIGTIRHIRAIWAFPQQDDSNWRAKEAFTKWWSLSAVGSHCIDQARWFANDPDDWKQFSATIANNLWNGPHDETAVIAAQLTSGPTVEVVSSVQFGPHNRIEIFGDKGYATCQSTMGREGAGEICINDKLMPFEPKSPFINQLQDLVECIETGSKPRADGSVGLRSVKDLLSALDSSASRLELPDTVL